MIIFELPLLRLLLLSPFVFPFIRPDDNENDDDDDVGVRRKDVENKNFMLYVIDDVSSKCCESKPSRDEQVFNKQKR